MKSITKNLVGMEDLLTGVGVEQQVRGGKTYSIGKINMPYHVHTMDQLKELDTTKYTLASLQGITYVFNLDTNKWTPQSFVDTGRRAVELFKGQVYKTYQDANMEIFPLVLWNGKQYVPTFTDNAGFVFAEEDPLVNADGTIEINTSLGARKFSLTGAYAVLGQDLEAGLKGLKEYYAAEIAKVIPDQLGHAGKVLTTDGVSTSWTSLALSGVPLGAFFAYPSTKVPAGFLPFDYGKNTMYLREDYPDLYDFFAVNCPQFIASATQFSMPDGRGMFLRGYDPKGDVDPEGETREMLTVQTDSFKSHDHTKTFRGFVTHWKYGFVHDDADSYAAGGDALNTSFGNRVLRMDNTGGDETRPKNLNTLWIMKAIQ